MINNKKHLTKEELENLRSISKNMNPKRTYFA
jgi:hypothetical protein